MGSGFKKVNKFCFWSQKVLPLVYDDSLSYAEVLYKVTHVLNKLIENNNELPDYIAGLIQKYITSGDIEKVVQNVVGNFILNVKYPPDGITPASGDGSADDTEALQGCIDYAYNQGGGVVYIPYGKYLVNSLTMRDGVSIIGFDRYSTIMVLKGGASKPLINGTNVSDFSIMNITLDGNATNQVNDLTLMSLSGGNYLMCNLICNDSYELASIDASEHVQIENIIFNNAGVRALTLSGDAIVQLNSTIFNSLSKVSGVNILTINTSNGFYDFNSNAICDVCCIITGNRNTIETNIINANTPIKDSGTYNTVKNSGVYENKHLSGDKQTKIDGTFTEKVNTKTEEYSEITTNINNKKWLVNFPDKTRNLYLTPVSLNGDEGEIELTELYSDNSGDIKTLGEMYYSDRNNLIIGQYNILGTNYWRYPKNPPCDTFTAIARIMRNILTAKCDIISLNELSENPFYKQVEKLTKFNLTNIVKSLKWLVGIQNSTLGDAQLYNSRVSKISETITILTETLDKYVPLINVKYTFNNKNISVYNCHLSLSDDIRNQEISKIINIINNDAFENIILMGDLNFDPTMPEYTTLINAGFTNVNSSEPTYPDVSGVKGVIDYIMYKGDVNVVNWGIVQDTIASDHSLLWCEIN